MLSEGNVEQLMIDLYLPSDLLLIVCSELSKEAADALNRVLPQSDAVH